MFDNNQLPSQIRFETRPGTSDELILHEIWQQGQYFRHGCKIEPSDVVLDIGAHIGAFALLAANLGAARVYAFEPVPESYELLQNNVIHNQFTNIICRRAAILAEDGPVQLVVPSTKPTNPEDLAINRWSWRDVRQFSAARVQCEVPPNYYPITAPAYRASRIFDEIPSVSFLKLGCEGSEYAIVDDLGDQRLQQLRCIICEYHNGSEKGQTLAQRLQKIGFAVAVEGGPSHGIIYARKLSVIPNVIHFTFGLASDFGGKPFSLIHYLAVRSALEVNKPDQIWFWYDSEPTGIWWERAKPLMTPRRVRAPTEVFERPLCHPAHRADVLRLQQLIEYGGIYLDLDVICIRPFTPLLQGHEMVMGMQGSRGCANAVMLAAPNARFLRTWYMQYQSFRSKGRDLYWDEHPVQVPYQLATEHPDWITLLGPKAFFWPLWDDMPAFLREDSNETRESYCVHLWESICWELFKDLSIESIVSGRSEFARLSRPFVTEPPPEPALSTSIAPEATSWELRLNLGCGLNRMPGWFNVDKFGKPDLCFDLETFPWPWPDNSVVEVALIHVLEHLGQDPHVFQRIVQELYRICRHGAKIRVSVPHPRHDFFIGDPTHVRPITPEMLQLLSKRLNRHWKLTGDSKSPLGCVWDVDFEVIEVSYTLSPLWFQLHPEPQVDIELLKRESAIHNNLIREIKLVMEVVK